jgi:hypothetical protein
MRQATAWSACSPNLNPLDFYLWGITKSTVYATDGNNVENLQQLIHNGSVTIRRTHGISQQVRQPRFRHATSCAEAQGEHFQHQP